jgi:hypothetical protein
MLGSDQEIEVALYGMVVTTCHSSQHMLRDQHPCRGAREAEVLPEVRADRQAKEADRREVGLETALHS